MIDLTNLKVEIPNLNYIKDIKEKSELVFDINFVTNKQYNIKKLIFSANKTKINLRGIKLNKNFETTDFKNLEIKTFSNKVKNNDFLIKKSKKIIISGEVFDAQPLLKSLYKKSDRKTFSKNFNSEVAINFNKMLTGTDDLVNNFAMIASINKGSYTKISSKGNFLKTGGRINPPIPLAVSATTLRSRRFDVSITEQT